MLLGLGRMVHSHKIRWQFTAVEELLLLDMIVGEELLQEQMIRSSTRFRNT